MTDTSDSAVSETRSTLYRRADRLPFRKLDDRTVIVSPLTREVHVLNGTASQIWELLDPGPTPRAGSGAGFTVHDLVEALEREGPFDEERNTVLRQVTGFVEDLANKGLLERAAARGPAGA